MRTAVVPVASYEVVPANPHVVKWVIPPVVALIDPCVIGPVLPGVGPVLSGVIIGRREPQA